MNKVIKWPSKMYNQINLYFNTYLFGVKISKWKTTWTNVLQFYHTFYKIIKVIQIQLIDDSVLNEVKYIINQMIETFKVNKQ